MPNGQALWVLNNSCLWGKWKKCTKQTEEVGLVGVFASLCCKTNAKCNGMHPTKLQRLRPQQGNWGHESFVCSNQYGNLGFKWMNYGSCWLLQITPIVYGNFGYLKRLSKALSNETALALLLFVVDVSVYKLLITINVEHFAAVIQIHWVQLQTQSTCPRLELFRLMLFHAAFDALQFQLGE